MSASAVLWPTDTLYDVRGLCCFNAQTCSGFSLHSILCLSKLGKQHPELSAATCSNPVITGPSVPCKNHNWNHLSICFLFSSPKRLHGQCDICKCNSEAPTEAIFFLPFKQMLTISFRSHLPGTMHHRKVRGGGCAVKNGYALSIHFVDIKQASIHKKEHGVWLKDTWATLWKCHSTSSAFATSLLFNFFAELNYFS